MKKHALCAFFCIILLLLNTSYADDVQLIRRLYFDLVNRPPVPAEIEWLTVYNTDSYLTAVKWLLDQDNNYKYISKDIALNYLTSLSYKNKPKTILSQQDINNIIKYNAGNIFYTKEEACKRLIEDGKKMYSSEVDVIDYFAMCLMSRVTRLEEINSLLQIYRKHNETDGYMAVIEELQKYPDVILK